MATALNMEAVAVAVEAVAVEGQLRNLHRLQLQRPHPNQRQPRLQRNMDLYSLDTCISKVERLPRLVMRSKSKSRLVHISLSIGIQNQRTSREQAAVGVPQKSERISTLQVSAKAEQRKRKPKVARSITWRRLQAAMRTRRSKKLLQQRRGTMAGGARGLAC